MKVEPHKSRARRARHQKKAASGEQNVAIIPSRRLVAVRLGYTPAGGWDLDDFLNQVLGALPVGKPHAP